MHTRSLARARSLALFSMQSQTQPRASASLNLSLHPTPVSLARSSHACVQPGRVPSNAAGFRRGARARARKTRPPPCPRLRLVGRPWVRPTRPPRPRRPPRRRKWRSSAATRSFRSPRPRPPPWRTGRASTPSSSRCAFPRGAPSSHSTTARPLPPASRTTAIFSPAPSRCVSATPARGGLRPAGAPGLKKKKKILSRVSQDVVTRYAHQTGHHVERRFGWDCHGLPIEYEIDKTHNVRLPCRPRPPLISWR
jgi:hypothetical protein